MVSVIPRLMTYEMRVSFILLGGVFQMLRCDVVARPVKLTRYDGSRGHQYMACVMKYLYLHVAEANGLTPATKLSSVR